MPIPQLTLKPKRDRSVLQRHPWLFSGAIAHISDDAEDGGLVDVMSSRGEWLALGYLNRRSQITAHLLCWDRNQAIDSQFWLERLRQAIAARAALQANPETTAFRLVNAESDGMPGLVIDRYGDWLIIQALTLGMEKRKEELTRILVDLMPELRGIYERSDADVREKEGLAPCVGSLWGDEPPELVDILETGHRFLVDVRRGHKTGFYLDQRQNRNALTDFCKGAEVLNAFAYSGSFGIYALAGGCSSLVNIDTSAEALGLARQHIAINGYGSSAATCEQADVFGQLRAYRAVERRFDVIILDPPRFALSRSHIKRASRGYKDINWIAFQLLRKGGVLFTFSCSGLVSRELFQKIVFGAALDSERDVQIIGQLSQASDHPIALDFPEANYLKGLICRVW